MPKASEESVDALRLTAALSFAPQTDANWAQ
jgi:hypothetical protein